MDKKAYLVLEDGTVFEGYSFGAEKDTVGELVFTTGMCGYIETLTDESYFGQIVLQTFPMIGNYGVIPQDFENKEVYLSAYIVKEWESANKAIVDGFDCSSIIKCCKGKIKYHKGYIFKYKEAS